MHEDQAIDSRHKAGWRIPQWCQETSVSRSTCYNLMDAKRLQAVKLGRSRIILTPPSEFLRSLQQS